ncbi:ABC transporter permease [Saccharothrix sp. ALI-22-I]|uniref:ABC transporter permease n=1 Tax=Saccharothrix sp. ALI-22-I TaxID=1933778 RepID=UPI00097CBC3E|nr:ABC transporter permease [Saccharothrix sp. ALI-22-I]ONI81953.1 ABC transporter permease [Saccharothrix sp. ALI-22-I]
MTSLLDRKKKRVDDLAESAGTSLAADAFRRMARNPVAVTGAVIVLAFVLLSIFAPWLAPKDPFLRYPELLENLRADSIPGPQPGFLLGSDEFGRDFFSRLLVASQQSLVVGVVATLFGGAIGMLIGGLAGALGGWVDTLLMRLTDILLSVPSLLLAISIAALASRGSQTTVIIAVAVVSVPIFARLLRGSMLAQRHSDHVLAATALGVKRRTIVFRHMLPNSLGPVIVQATLTLATSIIEAASLSFLGLGDPDPNRAEWGLMLSKSQSYIDVKFELALYPALAIIVVALGFTLLGESLREALDPKNRR